MAPILPVRTGEEDKQQSLTLRRCPVLGLDPSADPEEHVMPGSGGVIRISHGWFPSAAWM
jgi:hypothetical protein